MCDYLASRGCCSSAALDAREELLASMTSAPRANFSEINSNVFVLEAKAGSGKSYVLNILLSFCRNIAASATSGIAGASLLFGATCHKVLKLSVPQVGESVTSDLQPGDLHEYDGIVIDEALMLRIENLRAIDEGLRRATGRQNLPFGGKLIILVGHSLQLPPVVVDGDTAASSITTSEYYKKAPKSILLRSHRHKSDPSFEEFLDKLSVSHWLPEGLAKDEIAVNHSCIVEDAAVEDLRARAKREKLQNENKNRIGGNTARPTADATQQALDYLYGDTYCAQAEPWNIGAKRHREQAEALAERCYISSTNSRCHVISDLVTQRMAKLSAQVPTSCRAADRLTVDNSSFRPDCFFTTDNDYLLCQASGAVPPGKLHLLPGTPCFITLNLPNLPKYSRVIVVKTHSHRVDVVFQDDLVKQGDNPERFISLPRMNHPFDVQHVKVTRLQFPLLPNYAATAHKLQGATLSRGIIDLAYSGIFSHGMLYVMCSRFRSSSCFKYLISKSQVITEAENSEEPWTFSIRNHVDRRMVPRHVANSVADDLGLKLPEPRSASALLAENLKNDLSYWTAQENGVAQVKWLSQVKNSLYSSQGRIAQASLICPPVSSSSSSSDSLFVSSNVKDKLGGAGPRQTDFTSDSNSLFGFGRVRDKLGGSGSQQNDFICAAKSGQLRDKLM